MKPIVLSDIVKIATDTLNTYGDMPVWVETTEAGYEFNETHSLPVLDAPFVCTPSSMPHYHSLHQQYKQAFCING